MNTLLSVSAFVSKNPKMRPEWDVGRPKHHQTIKKNAK